MEPIIYGDDIIPPEESRDGWLLVRIHVPELNVSKCLQFPADRVIWDVKNQVLASLPKELKESFNYGLFCPPSNCRAGKFLDEERRLGDYPFNGPVGYLELKYKRRVYKILNLDEKLLKPYNTRANQRRFIEFVIGGHLEKITKLSAKGLDPNFHDSETGESPLTLATSNKKSNKLLIALVNGGAILDYRTRDGSTSLHKAVERDNLEAVTTLLELGASPNYRDGKGITPLYLSVAKRCDPKICESLLHDHATLGTKDNQGWQEVHQACRNGLVQHLEQLLVYGADMDARNASGNTPLHVCAVNNQEACAKMLLFRGTQISAHNYANQTAYQVAVIAGNLELAEIIRNYRPEEVVPFRVPPRYNLRRRSGVGWGMNSHVYTQGHSESPPSPCPSEQPFSSASSSLSEGSSSHRSHEDNISLVTDKSLGDTSDIISDSSGVGTNSDSTVCSIDHVCTTVVCVEQYTPNIQGHLTINPGDFIDIVSSTDCGFLEGYVRGTNRCGFFPSTCVQEMKSEEGGSVGSGSASVERQPIHSMMMSAGNHNGQQYRTLNSNMMKRVTLLEPRNVILHRAKRGFGFVLRGAKASSPLMEIRPSDRCPALQYLDDVDPGGVADMAGLKPGDFLLAINDRDVRCASHENVVELIRTSGALVKMTVISQKGIEGGLNEHQELINGNTAANNSIINQHFASSRQCVTLPRKMGGIVGRIVAPMPPRRDPTTTLSVGRARAKSMVAGLEGTDDKDDDDVLSTSKSISSESVHHRIPNSGISTPSSQPRTASIKSRPTSSRITAAELEELFQRQQGEYRDGHRYSAMMTTSRFQSGIDSGSSTPPASPQKGPIVYASVADMKRKKTNKNGTLRGKPCAIPSVNSNLTRNFHSTPDLATQLKNDALSIQNWANTISFKGHRSQDDINALRRLHLPPPTHPPPPPPIGQVVKVEVKSEYDSALGLQQKMMMQQKGVAVLDDVLSSFKPSAKLYASPQGIGSAKAVEYRSRAIDGTSNNHSISNNGTLLRKSSSFQKPTQQSTSNSNNNSLVQQPLPPQQQPPQPQTPHHQIKSPPIPDPDYSLSESDEDDDNSVMLARNTKYNAKNLNDIQLGQQQQILQLQQQHPVENSGTSNTSSESASSIPHSFSVDEIRNIRNKLKSSKSFPNNFVRQQQNISTIASLKQNHEDAGDNSSSGVSSDQEIAMHNHHNNEFTNTLTKKKIPSPIELPKKNRPVVVTNPNEPVVADDDEELEDVRDNFDYDDDDLSPSPPITGFQRHNSMTRRQATSIAMSRVGGIQSRPPVSLIQLPPPIENDSDSETTITSSTIYSNNTIRKHGGNIGVHRSDSEVTPTNEQNNEFLVLAPPPQFCDQTTSAAVPSVLSNFSSPSSQSHHQHHFHPQQSRSAVRIVGAVPKNINPLGGVGGIHRLHQK